jgi:hypothetical protein
VAHPLASPTRPNHVIRALFGLACLPAPSFYQHAGGYSYSRPLFQRKHHIIASIFVHPASILSCKVGLMARRGVGSSEIPTAPAIAPSPDPYSSLQFISLSTATESRLSPVQQILKTEVHVHLNETNQVTQLLSFPQPIYPCYRIQSARLFQVTTCCMQVPSGLISVTIQVAFVEHPMVRGSDAGALDRCTLRGHPFSDYGRWPLLTVMS